MRKGFGLRVYAICYLIFLYAPIVLLPIFAFNSGKIIAFPLQGFSTEWFQQLWTTRTLHEALKNSLFIAGTTAVLSTCLGMFAARAGAQANFWGKRGIIGFIMLPLVLPEIIVAVSLLVVVVQILDLGLSNWTIIAAHTLICTPFCIAILNGAFQNLDPAFEEAALDLGESRWSAFRLVIFPLVMPGVISSLLISFTISLDEFIIAFFLTGSNPTLPVYIWGLLRFPASLPVVMALGTILVALSVILLTIAEILRRRGIAKAGGKDSRGLFVKPLIELSGVQKFYGDYHALRDITVTIKEGEFFSLLGPSGCGKTTLLRTIAGFEGVSSGTVMIAGQNMQGVPANLRPTNMVFQSYAIFPHLSVAENVAFGLRKKTELDKAAKAKLVEEALDMVGLKGYGARAAHALSGGQRQRVALARALILKPKVLLLDEPLSALDKKMREQMQVELIRLQRQVGITFILVTHDQEEALVMSDRIAVMFEGEIGQLADPETLYRRPNSKRVAEFIGKMNFMQGTVTQTGDQISLDVPGLGASTVPAEQAPGGRISIGDVTVGIRPETLAILFEGETTDRRLADGVVDEVVYYGDMTYYDVRVDGIPEPLTISMKNLIGRPVLDVGTKTKVVWDVGSLVLLP